MICGRRLISSIDFPRTIRSGQYAGGMFKPFSRSRRAHQSVVPGNTVKRSTRTRTSWRKGFNSARQLRIPLNTGLKNSSAGVPMVMTTIRDSPAVAGESEKLILLSASAF
jgi:hypothetical protein